jgi:polyhydroxyalkanoate synthesis repressor PhaR
MSERRKITRCRNRRLYDRQEKRYINFHDIRDLVTAGTDFVVINQRTKDDITRNVLLEVVTERELQDGALMNRGFLLQAIQIHGGNEPAMASRYLDHCLRILPELAAARPTSKKGSLAAMIQLLKAPSRPNVAAPKKRADID